MIGVAIMAVGAILGALSASSSNKRAREAYEAQAKEINKAMNINLARIQQDIVRSNQQAGLMLSEVARNTALTSSAKVTALADRGISGSSATRVIANAFLQGELQADKVRSQQEQFTISLANRGQEVIRQAEAQLEQGANQASGSMQSVVGSAIQGAVQGYSLGSTLGSAVNTFSSSTVPKLGESGSGVGKPYTQTKAITWGSKPLSGTIGKIG